MDKCTLGKFIAKCRREHNMTQEELAEKIHVTPNSIKNIEGGHSYPSLEHLFALNDHLHFSIDQLYFDEHGLSFLEFPNDIRKKIDLLTKEDKDLVANTIQVLIDCILKNYHK